MDKVRENRLRRAAHRQGYQLVKSRRRDPRATDYGTYQLRSGRTVLATGRDLDEIEQWLNPTPCAITDPNHDHDGLWWSAYDDLAAVGREAREVPL